MSSISNRFYVTALEDGTTLHGNLASDVSLSQYWNGSSAYPDWTDPSEQPTIYLTLLSGATLVDTTEVTGSWYYNNEQNPIGGSDSRFQITTKQISYAGQTKTVPALKIISNLAGSSNTDVDTITYKGVYNDGGGDISFISTIQIRIAEVTKGSNVGVINFVGGVSDITESGQVLTMYGKCYGGENGTEVSGYTTKWYVNEDTTGVVGTQKTVDGVTYNNAFQLNESAVIDHATIRCEFYKGTELLDTAYASVDDMQDPEFMYVQYNGNNGNAASLRKGETATFQIWVGTRTDPTPIGGTANPTYNSIKVKLLDGEGIPIGGKDDTTPTKRSYSLDTGIPACTGGDSGDGWRDLTNTMSGGKATITPNYTTVNQVAKKNLTGIILAEHIEQS